MKQESKLSCLAVIDDTLQVANYLSMSGRGSVPLQEEWSDEGDEVTRTTSG